MNIALILIAILGTWAFAAFIIFLVWRGPRDNRPEQHEQIPEGWQ